MECPYCRKEMRKGYIHSRFPLYWTEKETEPMLYTGPVKKMLGLDKSLTRLENGDVSTTLIAYKCDDCKKVVVSY